MAFTFLTTVHLRTRKNSQTCYKQMCLTWFASNGNAKNIQLPRVVIETIIVTILLVNGSLASRSPFALEWTNIWIRSLIFKERKEREDFEVPKKVASQLLIEKNVVKWQFHSINSDLESTAWTVDIEEHFLILCWKIIV